MKNLKHTKGEWKVNQHESIVDENGYGIAQIHGILHEKDWKYNAKLMAAAPDLLNELIKAQEIIWVFNYNHALRTLGNEDTNMAKDYADSHADNLRIESLIKKATE